MSTYLSGTPTFLPSVQPYEPNLQLYAGALQMKQTQYDTNRKKISNLYGSLLNSPLTRQNSMDARDEYFNTIDYEIKKLANVDLSLEQNVTQATQLFSGLYENENIIKDMMWTKNYQGEMDRAEGFRNCIDPEKCGGQYWEGGVQALQYQRQEFQNITDDEAMSYGDVRYTPFINVGEKANKIFKDNGWNVKMDSPSADGKWIITTKNGEQIIGPLYSHLQSIIGKDPAIAEYYRTKSYLDRKNWVSGKTAEYGSESAALQEYINQKSKEINDAIGNVNADAQYAKENTQKRADDLKENVESGKVQNTDRVQSEYDRLFGQSKQFEETEKETSTALTSTQNSLSTQNLRYQAETIDGAMGLVNLNMDLYDSAKVLAYKDYERTFKANEFALNEQAHMFRMQEAQYKSQLEFENDKKLLEMEMQGNELLNSRTQGGLASDVNFSEDAAYQELEKMVSEKQDLAYTNTSQVFQQTYDAAKTAAIKGTNGSAQAELDLVTMTDNFLNQLVSQKKQQGAADADEITALYDEFRGLNAAGKAAKAKTIDLNRYMGSINHNMLNAAYKYSVKNFYGNGNDVNRTYLDQIKGDLSYKVAAANEALNVADQWQQTKKETFERAIEVAKTKGDPKFAEYYEYLKNANGNLASEDEFAFNAAHDYYQKSGEAGRKTVNDDAVKQYAAYYQSDWSARYDYLKSTYTNLSDKEVRDWASGVGKYAGNEEIDSEARRSYATAMAQKDVATGYDTRAKDKANLPQVILKDPENAFYDPKAQSVPYTEFFDKNGNINSKYAKYANSWTGDGSSFWTMYDKAKNVYSGGTPSQGSTGGFFGAVGTGAGMGAGIGALGGPAAPITATAGAIAGGLIGAASYGLAALSGTLGEEATPGVINTDFLNSFKEAFTDENVIKGAEKSIGLMGLGSGTAYSLDGYVDYDAPMSTNVIEEQSFLRDAFKATRDEDVYFSFGKAGSALPFASNGSAEQFVKQLIGEAIKGKKGERPTWVGSYNPIAGGSKDWQSYTFLINDPGFLKNYVGTKDNPGMYYDYFKDNKEGAVTVYLKDAVAQNALHVQTKTPEIEKLLTVNGSVPVSYGKFDGDISQLTMTRNSSGPGYYVNGSIATDIDEATGNYVYSPYNMYHAGDLQNPSMLNDYYNNGLSVIKTELQNKLNQGRAKLQ